jgi:uncharacterized protein YyaL (SSP411 family)
VAPVRQNHYLLILVLALSACCACAAASASNQLAGHPSPYLALHANDPVHWKTWQAEVFSEARANNRLVLVSVGYFSCHWCHVMQQQSYQDDQTATFLNRNFVSVKVDRELEPDLDQRLITFVEQVRGVAGWPLNVFITPDGYPLTGFTYLPRDDFLRLIQHLDDEWKQNHLELSASARELFELGLQHADGQVENKPILATALVDTFVAHTMRNADDLQGGFGDTSKFPNVPQLNALLDSLALTDTTNPEVADFIQLSLDMMASLNLKDHINGGFFRYTTDPDWHTPHFEKMLYDNALLSSLYLKAHRAWPAKDYATIALQTLDFVELQLKHPQGGYMSSLSAVDRYNREGGAYLWSREQLARRLDATELAQLKQHWVQAPVADGFLLRPASTEKNAAQSILKPSIQRKLQATGARSMPVDDKRLASWNAMMLNALTLATDSDPRFAGRAQALYRDIRKLFIVDDTLVRFAGNADIAAAVFEDYAYTANALFRYGLRFKDPQAIELARRLSERAHRVFLRSGRWQAKAQPLIPIAPGKWVIEDLVFYSPMVLWLEVALTVPELDSTIRSSATTMLQRVTREMLDQPYYHGSLIMLRANSPG